MVAQDPGPGPAHLSLLRIQTLTFPFVEELDGHCDLLPIALAPALS
jgi:hypothetical protein